MTMSGKWKYRLVLSFVMALIVGLSTALMLLGTERADRALIEADAYEVISGNPVPTIVCENNQITLWNPAMEFVSGRSSAEMIGEETIVMVPDELKDDHTEAVARVSQAPGFDRDSRFLILPIPTQFANEPIPIPSTVFHIRRHDGRVIMSARLEGAIFHPNIRWFDVTTKKYCRVTLKVTPEPDKPAVEQPKT
jgi:PAS domain-containing protein